MTVETITDTVSSSTDGLLRDKFVIRSPVPMIVILITYLLIILKIGPSYMKSRPAYQLKTYIVIYNVLQVIACVYLVYKMLIVDVPVLYFWECIDLIPGTAAATDFIHISHFTFWLKVTELSETVVFVLRKKQRQVSFLHVFHHCATLSLVFSFFRSYKTSAAMFPLLLNCNVHIVMYVYYLMAAVLPTDIVSKLTPLKKAITTIQIIQFILILFQVCVGLIRGCNVPTWFLGLYVLIISSFFYMFYDFYKKNYTAKKQTVSAETRKKREAN